MGIMTITEKWERYLGTKPSYLTEDYLQEKFPLKSAEENAIIIGAYLPNPTLLEAIGNLKMGEALVHQGEVIAYVSSKITPFTVEEYEIVAFSGEVMVMRNTWDIFSKNGEAIEADFDLLTKGRSSQPIPETTVALHPERMNRMALYALYGALTEQDCMRLPDETKEWLEQELANTNDKG